MNMYVVVTKNALRAAVRSGDNRDVVLSIFASHIFSHCCAVVNDKNEFEAYVNILRDDRIISQAFNKIYDKYYGDNATLYEKLCRLAAEIVAFFGAVKDKVLGDEGFGELRQINYAKYVCSRFAAEAKQQASISI